MKAQWIKHCMTLAETPADFYGGCRKILRGRTLEFTRLGNDLQMTDAGFTKAKMRQLQRNYHVAESRDMAKRLWKQRLDQDKYGSVGFHCYNHLIKGIKQISYGNRVNEKIQGSSLRASVMGPCIQAINLTLMPKGRVGVDAFYRTTELFKKFPADLVFIRDDLLSDFDRMKDVDVIRFHFANITLHPMYFVTVMPHLDDPLASLDRLRKRDKRFFDWAVKWTGRYLLPEQHRGIAKFAQALRVQDHAQAAFKGAELRRIQKYLRDNHPGHRNEYTDPEGDDNEE